MSIQTDIDLGQWKYVGESALSRENEAGEILAVLYSAPTVPTTDAAAVVPGGWFLSISGVKDERSYVAMPPPLFADDLEGAERASLEEALEVSEGMVREAFGLEA